MKALIVTCAHAYKLDNGQYFTPSVHSYKFFERYLMVFDEIKVVARVCLSTPTQVQGMLPMSGDGITFCDLPFFHGLLGMVSKLKDIRNVIIHSTRDCECVIYRVPQMESYLSWLFGASKGKPFAVEVVADPLGWTNVKGILKWMNVCLLKRMCACADGAAYVTSDYLQSKYPPAAWKHPDKHFTANYSSVELAQEEIGVPRQYTEITRTFHLIHISNAIHDNSKGHQTVIKTVSILKTQNIDVEVCFVGDGSGVESFKLFAEELGVAEKVHFIGRIADRTAMFAILKENDLMLFPSYSEGLPRCVIEALATGLPVLSTPIAGIPELVDRELLRDPGDAEGFAVLIKALMQDPDRMSEISRENVEVSKRYVDTELKRRRTAFYTQLKVDTLKDRVE